MLNLVIIAVYFLGVIAIGVVSRKKATGVDAFFVAGRKGSSFFITGSLLATIIWWFGYCRYGWIRLYARSNRSLVVISW